LLLLHLLQFPEASRSKLSTGISQKLSLLHHSIRLFKHLIFYELKLFKTRCSRLSVRYSVFKDRHCIAATGLVSYPLNFKNANIFLFIFSSDSKSIGKTAIIE
ncbi:hypothetical protein, partial [Dakarella massiliensis]|uniref:hypothetical protein n=1 Tax=Dakarella massiliensis TaxID=1506471 RepID=UPI001CA371CD